MMNRDPVVGLSQRMSITTTSVVEPKSPVRSAVTTVQIESESEDEEQRDIKIAIERSLEDQQKETSDDSDSNGW